MELQLFEACNDGDLETVKRLVHIKGLDWNYHNPHSLRRTALHCACLEGHVEIVRFLLTLQEVNANNKDRSGNTPLHYAYFAGHLEIVRFLLTCKEVNVSEKDNDGNTLLHHACVYGHLEIARLLLTLNGVNVNIKNKHEMTPLHYACVNGHARIVRYLSTLKEVNINDKDITGKTPLHSACLADQLEIVHFLLRFKKVNVSEKDVTGKTPLHGACKRGHLEIVRLLSTLDEINVNEKDNDGKTPLHIASLVGHLEIVRFLLTLNEANVNEKDNYGYTALHYACEGGSLEIIRYLIEVEGANYSIENNEGDTPICLAVRLVNRKVLKYFESISKNSNFSLSCQEEQRLQRYNEKQSISSIAHQDDVFHRLTETTFGIMDRTVEVQQALDQCFKTTSLIYKILETGVTTNNEIKVLAKCITTTRDAVVVCSIAKAFITIGTLTKEQCSIAIERMFDPVVHKYLSFKTQEHVCIKRLLDELKEEQLLSEDNYIHWKQQVPTINAENVAWRNEMQTDSNAKTADTHGLNVEYERLNVYFQGFYNACINKLDDEITFGLLRIGVSILRLIPIIHEFSGVMDYTMNISNPLAFCRFAFKDEGLDAFIEKENSELILKPYIKYFLEKSNIEEEIFISILEGLLSDIVQEAESSRENSQYIVPVMDDVQQTVNYKRNSEKFASKMYSMEEDTVSEVSSTQDEETVRVDEYSVKRNLVNLCKVLKGTIDEDDFIDEITDHQYITALHYSDGDVPTFKRIIKHISEDYSTNETAKLHIKREGSEDVQTDITAIQYAAICGYVDILEEFFLCKAQTDHVDLGLDNPVTYLAIASKRHKLLVR